MRKPILASYILLVVFILLSLFAKNMEFIIYAIVLIPVVILLHKTDSIFKYKTIALWGFLAWMAMHLAGGLASIGDIRLYDLILIDLIGEPYSVLRYDQFLHFYCYVVIAMLLGSVVASILKKNASHTTVIVITVLAATGIGAINEIVEFLPVILFDSPGPGGYTNTVIDIIMNFLGSIVGTYVYRKV